VGTFWTEHAGCEAWSHSAAWLPQNGQDLAPIPARSGDAVSANQWILAEMK